MHALLKRLCPRATRGPREALAALVALGMFAGSVSARTITITAADCDRVACISSAWPTQSWPAGVYPRLELRPGMSLLLRFRLDRIPKDQRILKAELILSPEYVFGGPKALPTRLEVRRLLADWGTGVNFRHSRMYPTKVEWSQPAARGASDRVPQNSGTFQLKANAENAIEVTQDVDLWYTGGAPNRGWIMNLEAERGFTYLPAPYYPHGTTPSKWKLLITYEPI